MANSEMKLSLVLTGRDDGVKRLLEQTQRETERLKKMQLSRGQQNVFNQRYATLGIRSEQAIRNEIAQTILAYQRLQKSGRASHNDLARAATATRNKIRELNNELNQGVQTQSKWGTRLGKAGQIGASVAAGSTAAYMAVSPELERYKALDYRLRETTWAAHGETKGGDTQWLETQGLGEIRALIKELINKNGGSTDLAIDTVQGMLANGLSWEQVKKDANATHNLALAAGENGQYDGAAAAKLSKVFADNGLDVARASQMAAQSGMQGTFEIADMVRELPSLLPDAKAAGFTGEAGLAYLLSSLQSASNKAGSTSEAANNVKNALQKALSADTSKRMDKILKGRGSQADWQKMVLDGQREGKNAMQVLGDFAQKLLSEDKDYQAAKKRADGGDEAAKQEMATMRAFMISKLLPDMQARGGLNAMIDEKQMSEYYNGLMGNKTDVIGGKTAFLGNSVTSRQEQAIAQKELGLQESKAFEGLAEAETAFKGLTAEFPVATTALQALAAAASAAALAQGAMGLLGRGGGLLGGAAGSAGRGALLGSVGRLGVVGAVAAVGGMGLMDATERINRNDGKGFFEGGLNSKAAGYVESAGSGAIAGAAIGSIVPVVGTAVGAIGGAVLGLVSTAVADWWNSDKPEQVPEPPRPAVPVKPIAPVSATFPSAPQPSVLQTLANKPVATSVTPTPLLMTANASQNHAKPSEPPEKLTPVITQQTATYQTALSEQTSSFQAALQADTAAVGGKLDAINGTLGGLQQTIQLTSTLNLDGRIIANEVSRHAVAMFGRGAAQ
ncbi:phage tail tape measure protein [Kingella kingae]|uniref:phage tail tape measure protein n=3 Tax=Kingella kingae TaxID=504 RepID=UPI00050A1847|nr:phage tail tape measure protein [Kingella kingae]MDK4612641.1 phage tail tape measure protein [Kingella kingae]